ncbi:tryptophan--tRNA ligase [Candidatus Wolfebacteria bacterium]|nr:MAG: tryptophan--tRNA ligase [Candidatus Wolfebacteria bacterium]
MSQKVILSGVKPSGRPHIGNYFGAMKQFVDLQNGDNKLYIFIADYHALNTVQSKEELQENIRNVALDYLAIGLDPEKVVLFKQSDIQEHTELGWIFNTITTMPYLMRAHAFKDAEAKNKDITVGTFDYPMLMAADILLYSPDLVPVGKDQKQHIEIARDTAEKFNRVYGETFKLPEPYILADTATFPGLDGQKMSKSYNNTIPLFGTDEEITKACMSVVTSSNAAGTPNKSDDTLFTLLSAFLNKDELQVKREKYESGDMGYKETKELLAEKIITYISPMRARREELAENPERIVEILKKGAAKAKVIASEKMKEVREKIGVTLE